jgi:hypothetical protein
VKRKILCCGQLATQHCKIWLQIKNPEMNSTASSSLKYSPTCSKTN